MTRPVVAAFDLDGTLTERDTLLPFLRRAVGGGRVALAVARCSPAIARAARDRDARDAGKERLLTATLRGRRESSLREVAGEFVPTIALRPEIVTALRDHQEAGHETLVISASPSIYVDALASMLAIDQVVATELEVVDGVLTGRYVGRNCRAAEKLARLERWLGGRDVELHAYGNSPDDDPLLDRADHAVRVR